MIKSLKNLFKKKYKSTSVVPLELYINSFQFKPVGKFKHDIDYYDDDLFLYRHNISIITKEFIDKFEEYVEQMVWNYFNSSIESVTFGKTIPSNLGTHNEVICLNYKGFTYDSECSYYYPYTNGFIGGGDFVKLISDQCSFGSIFQAEAFIDELGSRYFKGK